MIVTCSTSPYSRRRSLRFPENRDEAVGPQFHVWLGAQWGGSSLTSFARISISTPGSA